MARDKNRMAGDALEESSAGQVVAEDLSAKDEGFRNALERRIGTEEYDRIGAEGLDDPDNRGAYSAKEVISEFRNRGDGVSVNDGEGSMVEKYQGMVDSGTKFNNKATEYLKKQGVTFGGDPAEDIADNDQEVGKPVTSPGQPSQEQDPWVMPPATGPGVGGGMTQQVQQDNDISTNITGDGNTVNNNQDNSVKQSAGSSYLKSWMGKHDFFN